MIVEHSYHDSRRSPDGLWQLAGDWTDASGNGRDLFAAGTARWTDAYGFWGAFGDGSFYGSLFDPSLQTTGAVTISAIVAGPTSISGARSTLIHCGIPDSALSTNNVLYAMAAESGDQSSFWHEHGSGSVDRAFFPTAHRGQLRHWTMRRDDDNIVQQFVNGAPFGDPMLVSNVASGGALAEFRIFGGDAGRLWRGFACSVQLCLRALSDEEIFEDATYTGFTWQSPSAIVNPPQALGPDYVRGLSDAYSRAPGPAFGNRRF